MAGRPQEVGQSRGVHCGQSAHSNRDANAPVVRQSSTGELGVTMRSSGGIAPMITETVSLRITLPPCAPDLTAWPVSPQNWAQGERFG